LIFKLFSYKVFQDKEKDIKQLSDNITCRQQTSTVTIQCFRSSIWDETLYKAWSAIVYQLIPNVNKLKNFHFFVLQITSMEQKLKKFTEIVDADEVSFEVD